MLSKRKSVSTKRLRGFEKGKVGPVDGSDHIGGNYVTVLNEANYQIFYLTNLIQMCPFSLILVMCGALIMTIALMKVTK